MLTDAPSRQAHGVDRMFYLEPGALTQAQRNVVWLTSPNVAHMHIVSGVMQLPVSLKPRKNLC